MSYISRNIFLHNQTCNASNCSVQINTYSNLVQLFDETTTCGISIRRNQVVPVNIQLTQFTYFVSRIKTLFMLQPKLLSVQFKLIFSNACI